MRQLGSFSCPSNYCFGETIKMLMSDMMCIFSIGRMPHVIMKKSIIKKGICVLPISVVECVARASSHLNLLCVCLAFFFYSPSPFIPHIMLTQT